MDSYSYVVASYVQALCVPWAISPSQLNTRLNQLRQVNHVNLKDIESKKNNEQSVFSPSHCKDGKLRYLFSTSDAKSQFAMLDLEPWRQQLVVLAVSQYSDSEVENYGKLPRQLKVKYPSSILRAVLIFDAPEGLTFESNSIHAVKSGLSNLPQIMREISSSLLTQMSVFSVSRQVGVFKSPSLKLLDQPPSDRERSSARGHVPRVSSIGITKDGSISMQSTSREKIKQSARAQKFLGNLYLMAGHVPQALREFEQAAAAMAQTQDHLWLASTLDCIAVCLILHFYEERPFIIPPVALSTVNAGAAKQAKAVAKAAASAAASAAVTAATTAANVVPNRSDSPAGSSSSRGSRVFERSLKTNQTLSSFIPSMMETLLQIYNRTPASGDEAVPQTVFYDTILRFAHLLTCIPLGGGWTSEALSSIVDGSALKTNVTSDSPSLITIESYCSMIHNPIVDAVPPQAACRLLSALSIVYQRLDLKRKWSLCVNLILKKLDEDHELLQELGAQNLEPLVETMLSNYKWPQLEITILKQLHSLLRAVDLPVTRIAAELLKRGPKYLSAKEQSLFYQEIRSESEAPVDFWNEEILESVVLGFESPRKRAINHHRQLARQQSFASQSNLATANANGNNNTNSQYGAIIYNPFEKAEPQKTQIHIGEREFLTVTLRNPYSFTIDIFEVSLGNEETVVATEKNISLGPGVSTPVKLIICPQESGILSITKVYIHVGGCIPKSYPSAAPLELEVSPARPSLVLQRLSLQKGWAMLLEGERVRFTLTVRNTTDTDTGELTFGFNDSTVEVIKQALGEPGLSRMQIYEYEYFLYVRNAIKMVSSATSIPGNSSRTFEFEILGKRTITSATIMVGYGRDAVSRRLGIPLQLTCYASLELERCDIILLQKHNSNYMIILDFKNLWRQALDVEIESLHSTSGEVIETVKQRIDSQKSRRFLVPLHWFNIKLEDLNRPIESLGPQKRGWDPRVPLEQIRMFWLRENLLKRLRGTWKVADHTESRSGEVELRGILLNRRLVNLIRPKALEVILQATEQIDLVTLRPLTVKLRNKTEKEICGMLRMVPDDTKSMIWAGNLQHPVSIGPGEDQIVTLEIMALAKGKYGWSAIFDIVGGSQAFSERLTITAV